MSKRLYFELYQKFINNTISKSEYVIFSEWAKNPENQTTLREYMAEIWKDSADYNEVASPSWDTFKQQLDLPLSTTDTNKRNPSIGPFLRWAAALLILVAVGYGLITFGWTKEKIYMTNYGEIETISLPDGSTVLLNANSQLSWDKNWRKTGLRKVVLQGEAFFEVTHLDQDQTFEVETAELKIKVLGTSFNVNSRRDETDVALKTGKIVLDLKRPEANVIEMEPGDRVDYTRKTNDLVVQRQGESNDKAIDWVNGVLNFEEVSVADMLKEVEDLYGKTFVVTDSSLLERQLYTSIPFADWSVVLQTIEIALGVKIEENKDELRIKIE